MYFAILPINIVSSDILDLSCSFIAQVLLPYNEVDNAEILHIFRLVFFILFQKVLKFSEFPLSGEIFVF